MTLASDGRGTSRLIGVVVGMALFLGFMFSPAGTWVFSQPVWAGDTAQSVRVLPYDTSAERLRDPNAYSTARNALPPEVALPMVFGSSELSSPVDQNPSEFLPAHVTDFDLFVSGRGYTQSLVQALMLSAMGDSIEDKVVLIVSPQWFTTAGISPEAFQDVFSQSAYDKMMRDDRLPADLRDRLKARAAELGAVDLPSDGPLQLVKATAKSLSNAAAERVEILKSATKAASYHAPYAVTPTAEPIDELDWEAALAEAAAQGEAASSNEFNVYDDYFMKYMEPDLASLEDSAQGTDYSLDSPEWSDLQLFLDVAKAHDIDVLLISVPMNGLWYDYIGYDEVTRAKYYDRVRALAESNGAELADFADKEYEPYFLADIMHLGWRGWLDVTRSVVDFYRS